MPELYSEIYWFGPFTRYKRQQLNDRNHSGQNRNSATGPPFTFYYIYMYMYIVIVSPPPPVANLERGVKLGGPDPILQQKNF